MPHSFQPTADRRWRATIAWLLAVNFLAVSAGVPLPRLTNVAGEQGEAAYPCQHHRCGCASAAQCRNSCCCYRPSELLAWYHSRQMAPPQRLRKTGPARRLVASVEATNRRKLRRVAPATIRCDRASAGKVGSCCQRSPDFKSGAVAAAAVEKAAPDAGVGKSRSRADWSVRFLAASSCQGTGGQWIKAAPAVRVPPAALRCFWTCAKVLCAPADHYASQSDPPPTPPPRGTRLSVPAGIT